MLRPRLTRFDGIPTLLASVILTSVLTISVQAVGATESDAQEAAGYHESALQKLAADDVIGAIIELKNTIKSDPTYLPPRLTLAQAYSRDGAGGEAQLELENAELLGADPALLVMPMIESLFLQRQYVFVLDEFNPDNYTGPLNRQVRIARGKAHMELGQFDESRAAFAAVAEQDPSLVEPYVGLAQVALQEGQLETAGEAIDRGLANHPRHVEAWRTRASIYHAGGDLAAAEIAYSRVIELAPEHLEARLARAGVYVDLGKDEQAAAEIKNLMELKPLDPRPTYLQAILLTRAGDTEDVQAALQRTADNLNKTGQVAINDSGQLLLIATSTYFDLGENDVALDYLKRYLNIEPRNTVMRKMMGTIRLQREQYNLAIEALEPALDISPNDPHLLGLLAGAYTGINRHLEATPLLEKALEVTKGNIKTRTDLAKNLLLRGELGAALEQLELAYANDPARQQAGVLLATVHVQRGEFDQALEIANVLVEHDADNTTLINLLGRVQVTMGAPERGRESFLAAVNIDPGFLPGIHSLADLSMVEGGNANQAREWLTKALEADPDDKTTMLKFAAIEEIEGDTDAAVRWLLKARGNDAEGVRATLELVDLYLRLGDAEDAERDYPNALNVLAAVGRSHLAAGERDLAAVVFD